MNYYFFPQTTKSDINFVFWHSFGHLSIVERCSFWHGFQLNILKGDKEWRGSTLIIKGKKQKQNIFNKQRKKKEKKKQRKKNKQTNQGRNSFGIQLLKFCSIAFTANWGVLEINKWENLHQNAAEGITNATFPHPVRASTKYGKSGWSLFLVPTVSVEVASWCLIIFLFVCLLVWLFWETGFLFFDFLIL